MVKESYNFDFASIGDLSDKVFFITGGTAGLGNLTIQKLATAPQPPAHIFFSGRSQARADALVADLATRAPAAKLTFIPADLSSFASTAAGAKQFLQQADRLDVFMGVAGIMAVSTVSKEGYEGQFASNHLGHALLLKHLLPLLERTAAAHGDARIVLNSSDGHRLADRAPKGIDFDALKGEQTAFMTRWVNYGRSKLANILYARALAQHHPSVTAVAIHPGVIHTEIVTGLPVLDRWFVKATTWGRKVTPDQGVMNQVWAATAKHGIQSGELYYPVGVEGDHTQWSKDDALAEKLWAWTQQALADV